ncbi:MAG: flagellar hook capping FlgD N-terminal domain-containing protein [Gemmobacter sp.]|nr:flagellar hook capping FlgD N-terminal domain-containing protein [Gemmobacter sp.]
MEITPVQTAPSVATQSRSAITSDFDTFLKMLTAQVQNQDPMDPLDSSQFAVQLATFSGVEQQVRTNQMLESLSSQMGVMNMAQLAGWIGMEARVDIPVQFDGAPVILSPNPAALADKAVLVTRDNLGREVSRTEIPVAAGPYEWTGIDSLGMSLPDGRYGFSLESYSDNQLLGANPVEVYATVQEARGNGTGGVMLVFAGGVTADAGQVSALRRAN